MRKIWTWTAQWATRHKFWAAMLVVFLASLLLSTTTGNMALGRFGGQLMAVMLLIKGVGWLLHVGSKKEDKLRTKAKDQDRDYFYRV